MHALVDAHSLVMSEVMSPEKANFSGHIFGGYLLSLLDRVAYACAARYCGQYVVTLSVDGVIFKAPIQVGELVVCWASINYVGRTSMEVGIRVMAQNLRTQQERHTNSCYFTMVAVDDHLRPSLINKILSLDTPETKRRHSEALLRRELRAQLYDEHRKKKAALHDQIA